MCCGADVEPGVKFVTPKFALLWCSLFLLSATAPAPAAVSDPAATPVQTLTDALLKSMRAGSAESMTERYRSLEPVIGDETLRGVPAMKDGPPGLKKRS